MRSYKKNNKYYAKKETLTKYWKYALEPEPWEQPILTSNGTMGGDSFACAGENSNTYAYYMFDGNSSTYAQYRTNTGNEANRIFYFYNPIPLNISSLKFIYYPAAYITNGTLYGSNDFSNWIEITTFSHSSNTATLDLSYSEYYKYYKVYVTSANYSDGAYLSIADIYTLNITATQRSVQEATSDDYDFITQENKYYAFR